MMRAHKKIPLRQFLWAIFLIPFAPIVAFFVICFDALKEEYFDTVKDVYPQIFEILRDYPKQIFKL